MSFWKRKREPEHAVIQIEDKLVSGELASREFVCDLTKCKGACCVEGDVGAPLEEEELKILDEIFDDIRPFLRKEGVESIMEQGTWVTDFTGDFSTPLLNNRECAYTTFDEKGVAMCGIEQAHKAGATDFRKPVSCHLYPIRITKLAEYEALNYDQWDICDPACSLGESLKVPVYKFLKEALTRKYGAEFYAELAQVMEAMEGEKGNSTK